MSSSSGICFMFIRHGESVANVEARRANSERRVGGRGSLDIKLSKVGERQALTLGRQLAQNPLVQGRQIYVYSSTAKRALQTAELCLEGIANLYSGGIETAEALLEQSKGGWEGKLRSETCDSAKVKKLLDEKFWTFVPGYTHSMGESPQVVGERVLTWVKKTACSLPSGATVLVFSHGYTIKYLRVVSQWNKASHPDRAVCEKTKVRNTSVNAFFLSGDQLIWKLQDDVSHLD